jgi:hypothetical protein
VQLYGLLQRLGKLDKTKKPHNIMDVTTGLTSVGAIGGIAYGVSKKKSFWTTAGFAIIFAIAGAGLATAVKMVKND